MKNTLSTKGVTSFGEYIRALRLNTGLPIRKVAAKLDIDPSLLGKIERDKRQPTKDLISKIAKIFNQNEKYLTQQLVSDQLAYKILEEDGDLEIFKVAEEKVKYLMEKNLNGKRI